jgi:DNA-binding MarR family transcriptional regulator
MSPVTTALPTAAEAVQPRGCTNLKLRQLMRQVSRHYDAELARTGLRTTQYSLLSYVCKLGPVAPGALAQALNLDPSTLTRNLQPLVAAGWLTVGPGPDARSRRVEATESGREKRQEAQRRWKVAQTGINDILGAERVVALHTLIDESLALLSPSDAQDDEL